MAYAHEDDIKALVGNLLAVKASKVHMAGNHGNMLEVVTKIPNNRRDDVEKRLSGIDVTMPGANESIDISGFFTVSLKVQNSPDAINALQNKLRKNLVERLRDDVLESTQNMDPAIVSAFVDQVLEETRKGIAAKAKGKAPRNT